MVGTPASTDSCVILALKQHLQNRIILSEASVFCVFFGKRGYVFMASLRRCGPGGALAVDTGSRCFLAAQRRSSVPVQPINWLDFFQVQLLQKDPLSPTHGPSPPG